jgi:Domain of unknown function (DUF5666)
MRRSNCRHNLKTQWRDRLATLAVVLALVAGASVLASRTVSAQDAPSAQQIPARQEVGTVKAISGTTITLTTDAGSELSVTLQDSTKVLRVAPGSKDLKSAVAMPLADLKAGDRILVRGRVPADAKVFPAAIVVAMKAEDVQAKKAHDVADWQTRGTGGIVTAVDPAAGTITISTRTAGGAKPVTVQTTKATILRRYAPDSTKFDDAKPAPIGAIKTGDQLRARGTKNDDGTQFAADEIVSGSFRNIAGLVTAVDPATNTVTVTDVLAKKIITVKVTDQTQLRKLQPQMAQMIAMRLKGGAAAGGNAAGSGAGAANGSAPSNPPAAGAGDTGAAAGNGGAGQRAPGGRGGAGDFQQLVNRLPNSALTDFQKGDAVMVVGTSGADDSTVTAITLLGGVEAILAAPAGASAASQAMLLSPWSLGGPAGDAGGAQ